MRKFSLIQDLALGGLSDAELEATRLSSLQNADGRFEPVVQLLLVRAVPVIEMICRERGAARGLRREQTLLAIGDASARLVLRMRRPVRQPTVGAIAAQLAAECVDAQTAGRTNGHRLALPHPHLRLVREDARTDWGTL